MTSPSGIEHHTVIIVGGGPAGLALTAVLGGWHPWFRSSEIFRMRYAQLEGYLQQENGSLLELDFQTLSQAGVPPVDLFRLLHHPSQQFYELDQIAMEFRQAEPIDYLLISQEEVGGLWNNVAQNMFTLSPGQWMEFAYYPLAQHVHETCNELDVNDLIIKQDLVDYYHRIPTRFEQEDQIHIGEKVIRIEPHEAGFLITTRNATTGEDEKRYTCKYLVYAVGQRCILRKLGVPGEDSSFVSKSYDKPEDYPGERVLVVGGGRTADWAATELHDAGKHVTYVMRQTFDHHWLLISDSRHGLPYYARISEIIEGRSPRFRTLYETHVQKFEESQDGGLVTVAANGEEEVIETEHVIMEIGGSADYSLFKGFPPIPLVEKYDRYRFQVRQVPTHPHSYESDAIPNMYPGGYLAQGLGLVVIAMHGTTYAIAADILKKEGKLRDA